MLLLFAFLLGVIAGLRSMTAPAAVCWAVWAGRLAVGDGWLGFLGHPVAPWVASVLALGELVADKFPSMPSRKQPPGFAARLVSGGLCGAALGQAWGAWWAGALLGVVGAVGGTLGGAAARAWLAKRAGTDWVAAVTEDVVAVGGAALLVALLP